jgi:acetylornithine deacetylase
MKGGLVQALLAIRAARSAAVHLRGPVMFESVIEEECTGNGMLAARLRDKPVDGVVLTECVGQIATLANTGTMWVGVTLEGKPAYVGRAGEYVNAIEKAAFLIPRLSGIADEINAAFSHPAYDGFERPFTFSVGTIEGGDWPSNVPLLCRFVCRLSYPPGVAVGAIKELVERQIQAAAADDPWLSSHPPQVDYPGFHAEGWAIEATAPLVTALGLAHTKMTGTELETGVLFGTADARYLDQGEQAIYYGPTGGGQHGPDEYVDLDTLVSGAKVLARLIVEWCG